MKNTLKMIAGAAVALVALTASVQAIPITGSAGFTGGVNLYGPSPIDPGTALGVQTWVAPTVLGGDLSPGTPVGSVTIVGPWAFNSGAVAGFWSVGGYTFDLTSSWVVTQGSGGVYVRGTGVLHYAGYDDTAASWSFTTQTPGYGTPSTFTFSASGAAVPDGGATLMLLGTALSAVGLLRKKFVA